jgi:hypothetical protein
MTGTEFWSRTSQVTRLILPWTPAWKMPQRVAAEAALPSAGPPGYDQILLARRYAEPPSDDLVVETEYPS